MSWYDFDERYCEECEKIDPTEANTIEEEAVDKFREYIHKCFEKEYKEFLDKQIAVDKKEKELKEKQLKIEQREKDVIEAEKNIKSIISKERFCIQKEEETKLKKKFFDKFIPGTKVWICEQEKTYDKCPVCNGQGTTTQSIVGYDKKIREMKIKCPECGGSGRTSVIEEPTIYEGEITESLLTVQSTKDDLRIVTLDFRENDSKITVSYKNNNGIKTQKTYYSNFDEEIFLSKEECENKIKATRKNDGL